MGPAGIVAVVTTVLAAALFALCLLAPSASAYPNDLQIKATNVTKTSATLSGTFITGSVEAHAYFEWGTSTAYGNTTPAPPGPEVPGSGNYFPGTVEPVTLTGLTGGVTYHYRLAVIDADNVNNNWGYEHSEDKTFTTPVMENITTDAPTGITGTTADLHGSFDGDGVTPNTYYFEWGVSTTYGNTTPASPGTAAPSGNGRIDLPPVTITGLTPQGATYHYRVVVVNSLGATRGADRTLKTGGAPLITNLNTRDVLATSAELTGEINPRNGQTTYRFEWGPTAAYGNSVPVPDGDAGSDYSPVPVSAQIEGLVPGQTYHFRLVATNQFGTNASPDQTFGFYPTACPNAQTRQETRSNDLPDCRAYELVTPSNAQGTTIMPLAAPTSSVATNPPRLGYAGVWGLFPEYTGEPMNSLSDLYISTRTETGWTQRYIGLKSTEGIGMGSPPNAYLPNLYLTTFPAWGQRGVQATPNLSRVINYNWGYTGNLNVYKIPSNAPYLWDVPSGKFLERWPSNLDEVEGGVDFVGFPRASADFSNFVFSSNLVFAPGGVASPRPEFKFSVTIPEIWPREYVYDNDRDTGTVVLASRKADGTPFEGRTFDISEDGSHILMTEEATLIPSGIQASVSGHTDPLELKEVIADAQITGPLYLRVDGTKTYEIAPGHSIEYAGSTEDGSTLYLTSEEKLSAADHDSGRDLYVWRESEPSTLTLVSIGDHGNSGDTDACTPTEGWTSGCGIATVALQQAGNDGLVGGQKNPFSRGKLGIDGTLGNGISDNYLSSETGDIYFESPEQLVGERGEVDERNLYLYRGGSLHYVTTMKPKLGIGRIQMTPDGSYAAFSTGSSITDYDAKGKWLMYLYRADSDELVCASCRPDNLPSVSHTLGSQNGRYLTEDGRVFFSTSDALVPRDTNQVEDVYEYTEGRPQLITPGSGSGQEGYLGGTNAPGLVNVSANGSDVYFATTDTLVTQDHNGASIKIYDARTGGGFPAEREEPGCVAADECHGPGATPPPLPADRTSAKFGVPRKAKAHKAKKHRKAGKHKKKRKAKGKPGSAKQGGKRHG